MAHKFLTQWLSDAYGMEKSLIKVLESHAKAAEDHPEIRSRIEQHREETEHHAELVERCLTQLGEKPSNIKEMAGNFMSTLQGVSTGAAKDELVKNAISDYTTEHFEISSYKAIWSLAEQLGEQEVVSMCEQILADEESMASFLEENLPVVVGQFSQEQETEEQKSSKMQPAFGEKLDQDRE